MKKYDKVESDIVGVQTEIKSLNEKYNHLIETLDAFLKRLDDMETDNTARDAHLERL